VILVDTSVWIDHFNGYDSDEAAYLLLCIADASPLVIPGLVLTEILFGVRNESEAARVTRVMSAFDLAPEFERQDYELAAELYRACRARGVTPRSTIDCLIARLCLRYGYELLTKDRDFEAISRFYPLRLASLPKGVQDLAAAYGPPPRPAATSRRASAPRRSSRA
jgi:predicted nucleic acid-binding protein